MMPTLRRTLALALVAAAPPFQLVAQAPAAGSSIVIAVAQDPATPVPSLARGTAQDVVDQLFLHLATVGDELRTAGDNALTPVLARRWTRRDATTLTFELDPRARWHDGHPVVANDLVFAFRRLRNPATGGQYAAALRELDAVTADDERHVTVRFRRAYGEQLYDAAQYLVPLPAHLLAAIPDSSFAKAPYVRAPVGNGPYRWSRQAPGEFVELEAVPGHFRGAPRAARLIFRVAGDPEARLNLVLAGGADATDGVIPPLANLERLAARAEVRVAAVPTLRVGYLLFNTRARGDSTRAHPLLADRDVRRALGLALDRAAIIAAVYGPYAAVPFGPASQLLPVQDPAHRAAGIDTVAARALLAARGWADHDGDGTLDKEGAPLRLGISVPTVSAAARQMALAVQEQWRRLGIAATLETIDPPVFMERRARGDFDVEFTQVTQDPSPFTVAQAWGCGGIGGANVARFCDPQVDSLIDRARAATDALPAWRRVMARIEEDAPAVFLVAPANAVLLRRRLDRVRLRPISLWSAAAEWEPGPEAR